MRGYTCFAEYYDTLTHNVGYKERADYLCRLCGHFHHEPKLVLDLACGTGSLTIELAKRGMDIYGIDGSAEMLSVAQQKACNEQLNLLFLCQQMQSLDLYGTVDTVVCVLDSINHLIQKKELLAAFERIALFLEPGGYFLFDANTVYKHKHILANNTFVYDTEQVYCVWQNSFSEDTNKVKIDLDFFERDGQAYYRRQECFYERAYSPEELTALLAQAGLSLIGQFEDLSFEAPKSKTERIQYVARKLK